MADILYYIKLFDNYCEQFIKICDTENTLTNIQLKITHSKNVLMHCEGIANDEGLNAESLFTAQLCGLFHDIGRFEQFTKYKTFRDDISVYHGQLGVEVLKKEKFLDELPDKIINIVYSAVYNHGLISIPNNCQADEMFFSKLIRDADKADIFRIVAKYYHNTGPRNIALEYGLKDIPKISESALTKFLHHELISKDELNTLNDFKIMQLAWVFDINFKYTRQVILESHYTDIVLASITDDKPKHKINEIIQKSLSIG